ncbi:MAG: CapA family protein [Acidimicrobiales bacterium]|nr:CapA family protein [Acidimicrobiales bacterium]
MRLALAGDTMLGRTVGEVLARDPGAVLFDHCLAEMVRGADLAVVNLECAISDRGARWPAPGKPFFFRAPPVAATVLADLGVDCVTLANNHALDYGVDALLDTFRHLAEAGIQWVGAGPDEQAARRRVTLRSGCLSLDVVGVTDHPCGFAAGPDTPGVAYDALHDGIPGWLRETVTASAADAVLVTPHWGPNMVAEPVPHVRRAARALREAGATLVAGHSAHVFHGVADRVLYDLGDFIDDYAVDPVLRNDLGLLWMVSLDRARPVSVEAVPLALDFCHTRLAGPDEATWITARFRSACAALGTQVEARDGRLVVRLEPEEEQRASP